LNQPGTDQGDVPVFIVAGARREALGAVLERQGRRVASAAPGADAADAFVSSGALIAIADLAGKGAVLDALIGAVTLSRGALLVIAESGDPQLDHMIEGGATHFLPRPHDDADLLRALRLADRYIERLRGRVERRIPREHKFTVETETGARERIAARLANDSSPLGLLLIAFTRLEIINTAFGRGTGDALLDAVAGRIEPLLAESGGQRAFLTRMSGAEFVVTLDGLDAAARAKLADRIVTRIERPFFAEGHMVSLGCRIGIVESGPGDDATQLLKRASAALAEARASDGSPIRALSAADEGAALFDAGLQADLRRALDRDEIEILFQPQLDVASREMVGVEALARWQHPDHGELSASTLFAVAERSDYLTALSAHVQRRAAMIAAAWPASLAHLRVAINLTSADIARPDFVTGFFEMIDASGFPRDRLTVEITESGLMEDLGSAALVLADLRAGGCRVAIDDFGTGYSSLAYLKALPLDYLKIDKHLAGDISGSTRDRIVVRGVIDMARSLGLAVIAEGVETEDQLALLAAEGCNYYQGFLFSGPVGVDDLIALAV
jgi:EAL domain-containing protein (putative c-di-GMP-specific phosphodiesterase class I)/GGDEF domain-containing protein